MVYRAQLRSTPIRRASEQYHLDGRPQPQRAMCALRRKAQPRMIAWGHGCIFRHRKCQQNAKMLSRN